MRTRPMAISTGRGSDTPVVFHTTSGTTGRPQPLMFGPKGREVTNLLVGRMYRWMGLKPEKMWSIRSMATG